eukprot:TRINITY_DN8048_c0_g1_i1.p1 TRINITY_DN8048_c0_g1~~TRINITY_DN8048_c0_g1_i1.p1  ORF type:complete len:825 (+),score=121.68 TRINITY_DN8048_c0_g1_i1:106-2475(+)
MAIAINAGKRPGQTAELRSNAGMGLRSEFRGTSSIAVLQTRRSIWITGDEEAPPKGGRAPSPRRRKRRCRRPPKLKVQAPSPGLVSTEVDAPLPGRSRTTDQLSPEPSIVLSGKETAGGHFSPHSSPSRPALTASPSGQLPNVSLIGQQSGALSSPTQQSLQPHGRGRYPGRQTPPPGAHGATDRAMAAHQLQQQRKRARRNFRRAQICVLAAVRLLRVLTEPLTVHELQCLRQWYDASGGLHNLSQLRRFLAVHGLQMGDGALQELLRRTHFAGFQPPRALEWAEVVRIFEFEKRRFRREQLREGLDEAFLSLGGLDGGVRSGMLGEASIELLESCLLACQRMGVNVDSKIHELAALAHPQSLMPERSQSFPDQPQGTTAQPGKERTGLDYATFCRLVDPNARICMPIPPRGHRAAAVRPRMLATEQVVPGSSGVPPGGRRAQRAAAGDTSPSSDLSMLSPQVTTVIDALCGAARRRSAKPAGDELHSKHAADIRLLRMHYDLIVKLANDEPGSSDASRKLRWARMRELAHSSSDMPKVATGSGQRQGAPLSGDFFGSHYPQASEVFCGRGTSSVPTDMAPSTGLVGPTKVPPAPVSALVNRPSVGAGFELPSIEERPHWRCPGVGGGAAGGTATLPLPPRPSPSRQKRRWNPEDAADVHRPRLPLIGSTPASPEMQHFIQTLSRFEWQGAMSPTDGTGGTPPSFPVAKPGSGQRAKPPAERLLPQLAAEAQARRKPRKPRMVRPKHLSAAYFKPTFFPAPPPEPPRAKRKRRRPASGATPAAPAADG